MHDLLQPFVPVALLALAAILLPSAAGKLAPNALIVISSSCGPCHRLLAALATGVLHDDTAASARPVLISVGGAAETRGVLAPFNQLTTPVLLADYGALKAAWGVSGTPTTVVTDPELAFERYESGYAARVPVAATLP